MSEQQEPARPPLGPRMPEDENANEVEDLVAAARRGEESAWRELHARFTPAMRAQARRHRLSPSDVDEVVQFAWAQCFEHRHRIRTAAALPGWLMTTCRHRALRLIRERRRCTPAEEVPQIQPLAVPSPGPLDLLLADEERQALREAVSDLPERQRAVVRALLDDEPAGRSYRQVALQLAMPVGSIGPTRQRAVERLRRTMGSSLAA